MADKALLLDLRTRLRLARTPPRLGRGPRWLHPAVAEREYTTAILRVVDAVHLLYQRIILPQLPRLVAEASKQRGDAWDDDLKALADRLRVQLDDQAPDEQVMANVAASRVSEWNLKQWRGLVKSSLGVDLFSHEPWLGSMLKSWATENAQLISTLEDDAVKQVATWTQKGIRQGWRWEDIAQQVEDRFDVSRSRARFIARDQVGTLNGELTQARQTQAGVSGYYWETALDERVRGNPTGKYPHAVPSHWARQGKRFTWDDAPVDGSPGKPPNCRCWARPDLRGVLEALK